MTISICMATCNGAEFLQEQIDSIMNQTYQDFVLYISDDKSTDSTLDIILKYKDQFPSKIQLLEREVASGSAKANFLSLLNTINSDLYLFCDQDDVWSQDHIELLVNKYISLPKEERNLPVLIHSDFSVVDEKLNVIASSYFKCYKSPKDPHKRFYYLANNVTGGVCLINDALKQYVYKDVKILEKNIDKILMHDHLFALIAVEFGKKYFIDSKTNLYRQHSSNVVGSGQAYSIVENLKKIMFINKAKKMLNHNKELLKKNQMMMTFFLDYYDMLSDKEKKIIHSFINIKNRNKISRIIFLLNKKILRSNFFSNLVLFVII